MPEVERHPAVLGVSCVVSYICPFCLGGYLFSIDKKCILVCQSRTHAVCCMV